VSLPKINTVSVIALSFLLRVAENYQPFAALSMNSAWDIFECVAGFVLTISNLAPAYSG
jgi:hypothetical protein